MRLIRTLLAKPETRYIVVRYASTGLMALEALVFARLLGPADYGAYALVQQIALLLSLAALGHPAGFLYSHFRQRDSRVEDYYAPCALVQYSGGAAVAAIIGVWRPAFLFAAIYYAIQIPQLILEPMLRVRGRYALSGLGRGAGSTGALLLVGAFSIAGAAPRSASAAIPILLAGAAAGYGACYCLIAARDGWPLAPGVVLATIRDRETWRRFRRDILRPGVPLNTSSALLLLQNSLPRFFLERFHAQPALGVFSLAWQLSQGAMVMLSSLNAVSSVEIGKQMESGSPASVSAGLRRQFLRAARAGLAAFAILLAAAFALGATVYRDYPELVPVTAMLNLGYLALNITGSVTAYLFYERRSSILNAGYLIAVVSSSAACWAIGTARLWHGYQAGAVSLILIAVNLAFLLIIRRLAARAASPPATANAAVETVAA